MFIKIFLTIVFLAVMVGVGLYSRKQASSVDGFVLGGRSVGPWLTAFAYGTSYFSAVVFVGYAGQFGWKYGMSSTWIGVGNAVIGSLLCPTSSALVSVLRDCAWRHLSSPSCSSSLTPQASIKASHHSSRWVSAFLMSIAGRSCGGVPPDGVAACR